MNSRFLIYIYITTVFVLVCLAPSVSRAAEEYFTVQAGSYAGMRIVGSKFSLLAQKLPEERRDYLRVELINGIYALRIGRFGSSDEAGQLLAQVREYFPGAMILQAYIKEERIKSLYRRQEEGAAQEAEAIAGQGMEAAAEILPLAAEKSGDLQELPTEAQEIPQVKESVPQEGTKAPAAEGKTRPAEEALMPVPAEEAVDDSVEVGVKPRKDEAIHGSFEVRSVAMLTINDQMATLRNPSKVFFDRTMNEIYVVNSGTSQIVIYNSGHLPEISLGPGRGVYPEGIFVDSEGSLYVCQKASNNLPARLSVYNAAFFYVRDITFENIEGAEGFTPQRVSVGADGDIYLVGNLATLKGVLVLDRTGAFKRWLTPPEEKNRRLGTQRMSGGGSIVIPTDVAVDSTGRVFILSEDASKIYVFSPEGELLFSFGEQGATTGKMSRPCGIGLDETRGFIFVLDYMRHVVLVFDFKGRYISEFGGRGLGPGWFNYPTDLKMGPGNQIIVADFFNNRVQILATQFNPQQ